MLSEKMKDFTHIPAISEPSDGDGWKGEKGLVTEVMERYLSNVSNSEVYMCGPPAMLHYASLLLKKLGIDEKRIYFDEF